MPDANRAFIDTNILIYAYSTNERRKSDAAVRVFDEFDCLISTQIIGEFCNVCLRKLRLPAACIRAAVEEILAVCDVFIVEETFAYEALDIQRRYGFSYYDSAVVAAAVKNHCAYLLSEDLQDGQIIGGTVVKNPFVPHFSFL
ncbi:DNA-binding protein [Planctomycetales bacterium]|nr:DNA-binding protein [Planctomycetales bacterium]